MLDKDKQLIQELLAHPGWDIFKSLILEDVIAGDRMIRQSLRSKLQADLLAAGRSGESTKSASVSGQLDILKVVLDVPGNYLRSR